MFPYAWFLSQFKIVLKEKERSSLKVFEETLTSAHFNSKIFEPTTSLLK